MELTVLGTGSLGNCYLLNDCGKILILDAGIGIKDIKIGLNFDLMNVSGVFVSHEHQDHSKSADALRGIGFNVWEPYKFQEINHGIASVSIGEYALKSFPLPHDGVENRGACIYTPSGSKVLYMTDYEYCAFNFSGIDINTMMIECNYSIDPHDDQQNLEHVLRGHASLDYVCEFLKENDNPNLKNVILCHLSSLNADADMILNRVRSVVRKGVIVDIARKGKTFQL